MMLHLYQIILLDLEKIFLIYNKIIIIDDQIRDEKLQMISTEKLSKYQLCHQTKLVSMNILPEKKYYHQIKNKRTS